MLRHMNMLVAANIDFTCQPFSAERTGKIACRRSLLGEAKLSRKYREVFLETRKVQLNAGNVHEDSVKGGNGSNISLQMTHAARNAISRKFRKVFWIAFVERHDKSDPCCRRGDTNCFPVNSRYVLSRIRVGHRELGAC